MLRLNLEGEGFETILASDGRTALARISDEQPDLVLLDIMMPLLDGWFVLEELGKSPHRPKVIVVTAKNTERDAERGKELGADAYVTKPFDPNELLDLVRTLVDTPPQGATSE